MNYEILDNMIYAGVNVAVGRPRTFGDNAAFLEGENIGRGIRINESGYFPELPNVWTVVTCSLEN